MTDLYPWIKPILWRIDAERAHAAALHGLKVAPNWCLPSSGSDEGLATHVWGRDFSNPIGLAAGFDKHAEVIPALFRLGFGFVEVGGVTLRPQAGNSKPRLFRLTQDQAVINRMGLNSVGAVAVAKRLSSFRAAKDSGLIKGPISVNLGLNKESQDADSDYAQLAAALATVADILTINVSSPNTPGLRALQNPDKLTGIVDAVRLACDASLQSRHPTILVKIAPDLEDKDIDDLSDLALRHELSGLVISNTTIARPQSLVSAARSESGGLSGQPLFKASTEMLRAVYARTGGKIPLIGVGGVSTGAEAYEKIKAGASLVQLYSALVFKGPGLVGKLKAELRQLLHADGFASVSDAVGADHRQGEST
jgi:dihydroorotate dehydrogenase